MRTQIKINGELKDVEIENGEITIIEQQKNLTGWEIADEGTNYYCVCYSEPCPTKEFDETARYKYQDADYFTDVTLASNINRMQTLLRNMFRWQAENDEPINREREAQCKYYISYDHGTNDFEVLSGKYINLGFLPCFTTVEKARKCIDVFRYELIWLLQKFKWRMDG